MIKKLFAYAMFGYIVAEMLRRIFR